MQRLDSTVETETITVRVTPTMKAAFLARCATNGDSASAQLRIWIEDFANGHPPGTKLLASFRPILQALLDKLPQ